MSIKLVTCPRCEGRKGQYGFVHRTTGCQVEWIDCNQCRGVGSLPESALPKPEWREIGMAMRRARHDADRSLGEEARRRGISPAKLSDAELGKIDPATLPEPSC